MADTDYNFYNTRNEIIQRAFRIVGGLSEGEVLSAYQIDQGQNALNTLVKSWQTDHIFLWQLQLVSETFVSGSYYIPAQTDPYTVIGIDRAWWVDSNQDQRLRLISYREYLDIPNKADTGKPLAITLTGAERPTIYIYPTPDEDVTVKYLAICKLRDFDSADDTGEYPARFHNALIYGLADSLSDEYGLPLGERQYIKAKYDEFFKQAKRSDRERVDSSFVKSAY